jgi:hypothetical protein
MSSSKVGCASPEHPLRMFATLVVCVTMPCNPARLVLPETSNRRQTAARRRPAGRQADSSPAIVGRSYHGPIGRPRACVNLSCESLASPRYTLTRQPSIFPGLHAEAPLYDIERLHAAITPSNVWRGYVGILPIVLRRDAPDVIQPLTACEERPEGHCETQLSVELDSIRRA